MKIQSFKRLPVLPAVLMRLIHACDDEHISLQEITRLISTDPGLTTRVLYLANSAFYRTYDHIEHIDQAVLCIGKRMLKHVVLSAAVHQVFRFENGLERKWLRKFWRHSLLTALIAHHVAIKVGYKDGEQAFLAGLLHDVGRLVLYVNFPEAYSTLLHEEAFTPDAFLEAEAKIAAPHPEVAAEILSLWNIDTFIVDAVLYHHESVERLTPAFHLVKIVCAANTLARKREAGEVNYDPVLRLLGVNAEEAAALVDEAEGELEEMAQSLGIHIERDDEVRHLAALRGQVEDMATLFAPMEDLIQARDESEIVAALHEGIRALCDVSPVLLLLADPIDKAWVSYGDAYAREIRIARDQVDGVFERCLSRGEIVTSFEVSPKELTILDKQIIHRLGKEGIVLVPLNAMEEEIGLVAFGITVADEAQIQKLSPLLKLFAAIGATAIQTERFKCDQAKRIQEERLMAVNNLMRRIAHEINNPLSIIKNYLSILSARLGEGNEGQGEVKIIGEEIDRIRRILPGLSIKAEAKVPKRSRIDLNTVIGELLHIITPVAAKRGIEIAWMAAPSLPALYLDRDGVKQILINLLKNALEALGEGGKIVIETRQEKKVSDKGEARSFVAIEIADNGPGLDPRIKATLFEPCVSTKGKGHAGIGLSVVYQLVTEVGGEISCISEPGRGVRFTILLPLDNDD